ncbi:MAG: hypothetical protein AABX08_00720 [Nanoarchaeota archaeon]
MDIKQILPAIISALILSTPILAFDFPKTQVTIMGREQGNEIIELQSTRFNLEVHSLNQLKSVKLKIDDNKPRTICRNNCWDFKARKPIRIGLHNIKIILENYESQTEEHAFIINVRKNQ